jgi:hypothetical protein
MTESSRAANTLADHHAKTDAQRHPPEWEMPGGGESG